VAAGRCELDKLTAGDNEQDAPVPLLELKRLTVEVETVGIEPTFYSPNYSTKIYHCNSTECYFKGY
jgi:hypothetical protein